jgi:molybdate transport system substrate-binding protein
MDNSVRVLSTLALKGAVSHLAGHYEAANGVRIDADFAPTLALLERLRRGEAADLVILTREGLDELAREGRVIAADSVDLARSYVGIAVWGGVAHPDIASEAALRATLLAARVAYSRIGASGIFFAQLIGRLGIAAEVNARAVVIPSGFTAERLVTGEADLAVQQISELKQIAGVEIVGPIPRDLQTPAVFPQALWPRRTTPVRPRGCCGISLRPRPRRPCGRVGWSLEFARAPTQRGAMVKPICIGAVAAMAALAAPTLAHAQSADLVLCDRLAADPSDPDRPADVRGVPDIAASDLATAIKYCSIAGKSSRRAMYQLGRAYAANRQMTEAIAAWRKAADKGSTSAMVELGVLYGTGAGVARDEAQARKLFERAATAGNPRGVSNLAALGGGAGSAADPARAGICCRRRPRPTPRRNTSSA